MKILVLSLLASLFLITTSYAQNFEGSIKFKMEYAGEMASQMAAFAPNGMEFITKGSDTRFAMKGGMSSMLGTFVVKGKENLMYIIKDGEKKAYEVKIEKKEEQAKPKVTKEKGTKKILGYTCQKYTVEITAQTQMGKQEITQTVWASKDLKIDKPKGGSQAGGNMHIEGVEGIPLETIAKTNVMGMEITTTTIATEIDKSKPKKSAFEVPKGYEVEQSTIEEVMSKMMGGFGK